MKYYQDNDYESSDDEYIDALENKYLYAKPRNLVTILTDQCTFSEKTFGPRDTEKGYVSDGVIDHIEKELKELRIETAYEKVVEEWIDVAILALDGAWRAGASPEEIYRAYVAKLEKNKRRQWPDWRTAEPGKAIEHVRGIED